MDNKVLYAPYIDGLRAIAVLSVIVYHLNPHWLPGGFAGVDVFFVISGFVVAGSVGSLQGISLPKFFLYFYSRRLVRITPALVACLIATSAALAILVPEAWLSHSNQETGFYAFFGLSNFILAQGSGYFSPISEFNPFTHTWSLAVEEQFYVVFPVLFFAWLHNRKGISVFLFVAGLIASFMCAIWLAHVDQTKAFYLTWGRFWELGVGVLLYQFMSLRGHSFTTESAASRPLALVGDLATIALIVGLAIAQSQRAPFPTCVLPVLATAAVLGCLHGRKGGIARTILTHRVPRFIGKISYSLYLWHWPVFVMYRWTTGLESTVQIVSAVVLVTALSVASYYFIETPPRRAARRLPRIAAIGFGLALIASGCAASSALDKHQPRISMSTVTRNAADWYPYGDAISPDHPNCVIATTMTPIGTGYFATYARANCSEPVRGPRVFAIGDSHAVGYEGLYRSYAMATGAQVTLYNNGGCPFLSLQPWRENDANCKANTQVALADMLQKLQPGDVVFLPSLRLPRFADQWIRFTDAEMKGLIFDAQSAAARNQAIIDGESVLREFTAKGARVVLEAPKPIFRSPTYRCAESYNRTNPICKDGSDIDRTEIEALRKPALDGLKEMASAVPAVSVWDPFPILCPAGANRCSAYRDGKPLFFDGDHLSGFGNRLVAPSFEQFVTTKQEQGVVASQAN
ncbi:peptidoglycan/LPS O-acetylase OafA/YrhL [Paraburkholderia eburnea]|uniref:Peptidoglycan/LPS O-acetylase OafA/YrhL n=1 Tax=Paraburkholderia eburnea TaxID=1189126 RepID=A0A2S4MMD6_9BURK|nr:acyltransferase family protein [Paraburkholderia eburnea]POR55912.1 peptidoglycan/LPS O-acetylase OafA/YrhL [Paraburkholderia eburnea]PRZ27039.1 peptidoglycan/LPS O-acetylase OafA/YrhL [Paraburkholderia eburnea]